MNEILIVTGSVCLSLALIEAWLLVSLLTNPASMLAKIIPDTQELLKSHLDYLLMSLFLFVFYLLFAHFQIKPSAFLLVALCLGSLANPGLFLIRAMQPSLKAEPTQAFQILMGMSCLATTVGYLSGAWRVAMAAIALM